MDCTNPIELHYTECGTLKGRLVPCGKCLACRIAKTREWSLRLLYELKTCDFNASFITLTYDNEHLPLDIGLHKKDLQDFWKRLRKDLDFKIKYYACGEYGDKNSRPHYHAIIFGLKPDKVLEKLLIDNWSYCDSLRFTFGKGYGSVTPDSIGYVTGYVRKKLSGDLAKQVYGDKQPPFACCSRGLGLGFALENAERIKKDGYCMFNGSKLSIPRYFLNKLDFKPDSNFSSISRLDYLNNHLGTHYTPGDYHGRRDLINRDWLELSDERLKAFACELDSYYNLHRSKEL